MTGLVRRDQNAQAHVARLRTLVGEGLDSGVSGSTQADIRKRVEDRLKADGRL